MDWKFWFIKQNYNAKMIFFQVYDRLHTTNNQIILFEEKYIALRNRLDIIRQVKESPIMFATALTECLRRSVLQPVRYLNFFKCFNAAL